jgi:hypothetical protein
MRKYSGKKQSELGVGQVGPRPARQRIAKAELMDLFGKLREHGIGCWAAQELTGYNASLAARYCRDLGYGRLSPTEITEILISKLPDDLKAQCHRVKTLSGVAIKRAENRRKGNISRCVHKVFDEEGEPCVNDDGAVRPQEAA